MAACVVALILGLLQQIGAASWGQPGFKPVCQPALDVQWDRYSKRLASVAINGEPIVDKLGQVLQHPFALSRNQAERGLAFKGSNTRIKQLVQALLNGTAQINIGLVAGPISCPAQKKAGGENAMDTATPWVHQFASYLQGAFPATEFTVKHVCYGPTQPIKDASTCLLEDMPDDLDLVLIELTGPGPLQNNFYRNLVSEEYELLLRRALAHAGNPAVVALHALRAPQADGQQKESYSSTYEDLLSAAVQYYDVPWLSLRDALWLDVDPDAQTEPPSQEIVPEDTEQDGDDVRLLHVMQTEGATRQLGCRQRAMHPELSELPGWTSILTATDAQLTDLGHRMVSDLLVWLIQHAALDQMLHPADSLSHRHFAGITPLPQPIFPGNLETRVTSCSARVLPISDALKAVLIQGLKTHSQQAAQNTA